MIPRPDLKNHILIDLDKEPIIFDYIQNGVTITDKNSIILYTNPAFTKITGYSKKEVKGKNPGILHSGHHDKKFYEKMWAAIMKLGFWEGEIWNRRKSGEVFPEFLTISKYNVNNTTEYYYIAVFSDISFLEKDERKILHLAFYDPLTELPNRNLYFNRINHIIEIAKNEAGKNIAIFYMDLDKFKNVNDTYGHIVGDELLRAIGERLKTIFRARDTIARIGGDEFTAIVTSPTDNSSLTDFATRILEHIEKPFSIDGHNINISISIGIALYPNDAHQVKSLLENADKAMYQAKKTGSKIVFYDSAKNS